MMEILKHFFLAVVWMYLGFMLSNLFFLRKRGKILDKDTANLEKSTEALKESTSKLRESTALLEGLRIQNRLKNHPGIQN